MSARTPCEGGPKGDVGPGELVRPVPVPAGISPNRPKWTPMEEATSSVSPGWLGTPLLSMLLASHTVKTDGTLGLSGGSPSGKPIPVTSALIAGVHNGSPAISGSLSLWKGKSACSKSWLGGKGSNTLLGGPPKLVGLPLNPSCPLGLIWFLVRLSAAACAWQLPHACTPSLPTCWSQNSDLPSTIASSLAFCFCCWRVPVPKSATKSFSLEGCRSAPVGSRRVALTAS